FEIIRQKPTSKVILLDPAINMLFLAKEKALKKNVVVSIVLGEGENLPFKDESFDGITIAFGIRNVENRHRVLKEFYRVLKDNGVVVILEFSKPRGLLGVLYDFYFHGILPLVGWVVSGDREAYRYLPDSVEKFPTPIEFIGELRSAGFKRVIYHPYTMGICYCYKAYKR
ncbi:MAG: ubiquinone/menaquinone biosynthesis methyltransferase, partial [Thermosulfidibacteraceae bacterium]